jgi:microcystin-dependent protein
MVTPTTLSDSAVPSYAALQDGDLTIFERAGVAGKASFLQLRTALGSANWNWTGAWTWAGSITNPTAMRESLGLGTAATQNTGDIIPVGGIIMWSGSVATIPANWALCNGANGTPDLRDRFVVGAGAAYSPGNTGGANTVALTEAQLPTHGHGAGTLTAVSNGAHAHSLSGSTDTASLTGSLFLRRRDGTTSLVTGEGGVFSKVEFNGGSAGRVAQGSGDSATDAINFNASHTHSLLGTATTAGAHTHTLTGASASAGSGEAHENRPPYFALAYIMRVA